MILLLAQEHGGAAQDAREAPSPVELNGQVELGALASFADGPYGGPELSHGELALALGPPEHDRLTVLLRLRFL